MRTDIGGTWSARKAAAGMISRGPVPKPISDAFAVESRSGRICSQAGLFSRRRRRGLGGSAIESDSPSSRPLSFSMLRWPWLIAAVAWASLIAGTSSTVILPHDFFAWIASHLLTDPASFRRFAAFWGYSWFAIVKGWHAVEFAILFLFSLSVLDRLSGARRRATSRWP